MPTVAVKQMHLVLDPWLEATRALEEERRLHPGFADLRHLLGLLYLAKGDAAGAALEFEAALASNPGYKRARFNLLVSERLRDGSLDPARWSREQIVQDVEEPDRSLWTAWFLAQSGDATGARQVLERLEKIPAWTGPAQYARAVYEAAWKDLPAARRALEGAATSHPLYAAILAERGWSGLENGGAKADSRALARILPVPGEKSGYLPWDVAASELYEHLGTLCARAGRPDLALRFFQDAFLHQGSESHHQIRMARLAVATGDEEEAVRALTRAIEVDPVSVPARIALGFEYQSQGYAEEALVQFEVAARLRPEYPDVLYNLGLLYQALGREEEARFCLRRSLDGNPGYFQARATLAQILIQKEMYAEALTELDALSEGGLRSADLHVQKSEVYLALSQPQQAVQQLEAAVALNPGYARSYYVLGQAYRQLGLRRKARSAWQQYLDRSRAWREEKPVLAWEEGAR
jgi:tetratricopeptide (TPR) repeat protein